MPAASITVLRPGLLATVQDLGRRGLAHLAVSGSGAADPASLRLANRLVGNPEGAAGVETTLLGAEFRLSAGRWVAVTGADCELLVGGRPAAANSAVYVPAGRDVSIGPARRGVRSYLAVGGGIAVPPVFGSRSTDMLSGIGPPPLGAGDVLPLGHPQGGPAGVDVAPRPGIPDAVAVRLLPGPRRDWFVPAAVHALGSEPYRVTSASDRVGLRLDGPALPLVRDRELPSEGMVLGAIQVPAGGLPLVFLADHPTTGGYPVIGVVHAGDLGLLAQAAPGVEVRFHWWSPPPR